MLERLLELVESGGPWYVSDLARELDTTPLLVEAMLEDLCRMGRLEHVDAGCAGGCGGCPTASHCVAGSRGGRKWALVKEDSGGFRRSGVH